jgi:hypothetical protein
MNTDTLLEIRKRLDEVQTLLSDELIKLDWRHLAMRGEKILAIKAYRIQESKGETIYLSEAKKAVEEWIAFMNNK